MKAGPAKAVPAKTAAARQSAASQAPASLPPHRVEPAKKPQASLGGEHRAKIAEAATSGAALREGLPPVSARP